MRPTPVSTSSNSLDSVNGNSVSSRSSTWKMITSWPWNASCLNPIATSSDGSRRSEKNKMTLRRCTRRTVCWSSRDREAPPVARSDSSWRSIRPNWLGRCDGRMNSDRKDPPPRPRAAGLWEQPRQGGPAGRAQRFKLAQHQAELVGPLRWADEFGHLALAIERDHARRVILFEQEPRQRRRQHLRAFELRAPRRPALIFHRRARVAHDIEPRIGLLHVPLDAEPVAPRVQTPIKVPQVIPGLVIPVITELLFS